MKGLLLRLSALDADAAAALRVIAHFEVLLTGRLDAESLVRSTAGLAECPAGLELDGRTVRFGPSAAFCRTGTLRQAAAELHLHHSTVAVRLAQVESALGWHLTDPRDRFRAQLALHAMRLAA
jgi:hypothetical protein